MRTHRLAQALLLLFSCVTAILGQTAAKPQPATQDNPDAISTQGLLVGRPKVYDSYYLKKQLDSLKAQLERLQVLSATTLTSHIGNVQGADLQQLGGSVQIAGPSTPALTSVTGTTPSTTSTGSSLAPSNPSAPPSTLTMPTPAQSSLDTLNESMQLASEITNLELLLDGALNDKLDPRTGKARRTYTIGIPITFSSPDRTTAHNVENAAAQIQVAVCRTGGGADIMTLLPQERTYNVAGLVDHSFAGSAGGVLSGVLSVGGGFLWSHKRYDVVQQQETIALLREKANCAGDGSSTSAAFVWQVYPVLGNKFVRQGTQEDFVQFSVPEGASPSPGSTVVKACVSIGWTKSRKSGTVLDAFEPAQTGCFDIPYFNTTPDLENVRVVNTGATNLLVTARGSFLPGTAIRIGPNLLTGSAIVISPDSSLLTFRSMAEDLLGAGGASVVSRQGDERTLANASGDSASTALKIDGISLAPYTESLDLLSLKYTAPSGAGLPMEPCAPLKGQAPDLSCIPSDPYIVTIGSKIYGLADSPFLHSEPGTNQIKFLASPNTIVDGSKITLQRLLWSRRNYYAEFFPATQAVSVAKVVSVSSDKGLHLAVIGANLDNAMLKYPEDCKDCFTVSTSNFALVNIPVKASSTLKQLIFCRSDGHSKCNPAYPPTFVDIPKEEDASKPKKTLLKKGVSVPLKAQSVSISGSDLDQIVGVTIGRVDIGFRLSTADPQELVLDLPLSFSSRAGSYILSIHLSDKSVLPYILKVQTK